MLSCLSLPVWGQGALDDCIRYAWEHHPGLKNAYIDVRDARTDYVAAVGKFFPRLSVQAEVGRHTGRSVDPDTNGYTADSYNQGTVGMEMTLSLFEGFTRVNGLQYARWAAKGKQWDRQARRNELAYQVAEAYYKALLDEQLSVLAAEQLRLGEHYLRQAERFVELGLKSVSDLQEVKARHQGDVFRQRSCEKNRRLSFLCLKERMGMAEGDTLPVPLSFCEDTLLPKPRIEPDEVYRQSVSALPDYKRMEAEERAARKGYAVALGKLSPTVFARFSWGADCYHSLFSLRQLRRHGSKYVGVGVSFPILSGLDRYAGAKKKRLDWQRVRNSIEEERLRLRNETEQLALSLQSGWEEHRQAVMQVEAETQVLKETERKWEEGLVSVFQLMEARNRLLGAKAERTRVRLQYELAVRLAMYYRTGSFIND